jgi:hypothetical protein
LISIANRAAEASDGSAISIKRNFLPFGNQVPCRSPLKPYG